jgi:hypothetical protein
MTNKSTTPTGEKMGTDIHTYVEVKKDDGWTVLTPLYTQEGDEDEIFERRWNHPLNYNGRNYNLFAFLADVRNGYGFAGVSTHEPLKPITPKRRGVPEDMSEDLQREWEMYEGHSPSHLTLTELREGDWDQPVNRTGLVDSDNYTLLKEKGLPSSWCGGYSGPNISNEEMEKRIKSGDLDDWPKTRVYWSSTLRDNCSDFLEEFVPRLDELAEEHGGSDNVRIVFWFDS